MTTSREKLIIREACKLHAQLSLKYSLWSAFGGFASGVFLMWILEKLG
jgi:hypothetical protein